MEQPVSIRPYHEAYAAVLLAAVRESYADVSPWMVWCRANYSLVDAATWIRASIAGHVTGSMYEFAIVDDRGSVVGACGVNHINAVDRFASR